MSVTSIAYMPPDTPAVTVLSEAIDTLTELSDHVLDVFEQSMAAFKQ